MSELHENIAICVFTFITNRNHYNLLNTTDVKELRNVLHYSDDRDDELYVDRNIILKSETGKEKKYKITNISVHYFQGERFINRDLIGEKSEYNVQVMVWLDEAE
jgi:hypothetical protein